MAEKFDIVVEVTYIRSDGSRNTKRIKITKNPDKKEKGGRIFTYAGGFKVKEARWLNLQTTKDTLKIVLDDRKAGSYELSCSGQEGEVIQVARACGCS